MRLMMILRLWAGRLGWLLASLLLVVLVAHLPEGFVRETREREQPLSVPRQVGEPMLVRPATSTADVMVGLRWSSPAYAGALKGFAGRVVTGEVLRSTTGPKAEAVGGLIKAAFLTSAPLLFGGLVGGGLVGMLLGGLVVGPRLLRGAAIGTALITLSLPDFFLIAIGQLLTTFSYRFFGVQLWTVGVPGGARAWLLPVLAIGLPVMGYAARLTVNALDEIMKEEYIRAARAKGLSQRRVLLGHAFRNALPRVLVGLPGAVNLAFSSLVVVEVLTSRMGLGRLALPGSSQTELAATAGLLFCLLYALLDGLAQTVRVLANPLLKEGEA